MKILPGNTDVARNLGTHTMDTKDRMMKAARYGGNSAAAPGGRVSNKALLGIASRMPFPD